ncbi:MAG: hypothetical protein AB9873_04645 [Syntrophobacteraceae bacterium]
MTQILIHRAEQGVVIATDSRAVAFSSEGEEEATHLLVRKIFHPLPNVILVTAGAGYGIWLCEQFGGHIAQNGLNDATTAANAALPFLQPLAEALKKKHLQSVENPHLDRIYIIVAGIRQDESGRPSTTVRLFAAEQASESLHEVEVAAVVTIPRQVTLEYRLSRLDRDKASLDAIEQLFERFLGNTAEVDDDVGPPFHFVRIQPAGIEIRSSAEG